MNETRTLLGGESGPESHDTQSALVFVNQQLSYLGQGIHKLPSLLIKDYAAITKRLDLTFNKLRSLEGLESFSYLEELILDDNQLEDDVNFPLMTSVQTLTLNKNNLTDLETLIAKLKIAFPRLKYLSLLGNVACPNKLSSSEKDEEDYQRYRYYVIYQLPHLQFLDSSAIKPWEICEAKRVGQYMVIARPDTNKKDFLSSEKTLSYNPLPESVKQIGDHKTSFGKSKYLYYGRNSEGNRYIKNMDL